MNSSLRSCKRHDHSFHQTDVKSLQARYKRYRRRLVTELLEARRMLTYSMESIAGLAEAEGGDNHAPILAPIGNRSIYSTRFATNVQLSAFDANNDPLVYSANSQSYEYYLDQSYSFRFAGGDEYFNWLGRQEKWILGHAGWFYILPNGDLYRWNAYSGIDDAWVDSLPTSDYVDTKLLYDAQPGNAPARIHIHEDVLSIHPQRGFAGRFVISVTVSDGRLTDSETIVVHVLRSNDDQIPPTVIDTIPNSGSILSKTAFSFDVTFSESVQAIDVSDLEWSGPAAISAIKQSPKLISGNTWRFDIANLRNGSLRLSLGNDAYDIEDISENSLQPVHWDYMVQVESASASPVLLPIPDQIISNGRLDLSIDLVAHDSNFDPLEYSASVSSIESHLDQIYQFEPGNEYYNYSGFREKWVYGSQRWYYILPTGELYRSDNYSAKPNTDLRIESLPTADYVDISRLHSPSSVASPASVLLENRRLTINPEDAFKGRFVVSVKVSDGTHLDVQNFYVRVLEPGTDIYVPTIVGLSPVNDEIISGVWTYIDIEFSEPVQDIDASDLLLSGSAATHAVVGMPLYLGGNKWRFPVNDLAQGRINATLAAEPNEILDYAGNRLEPVSWSFFARTTGLLFQFPPSAISFTSADLVLNFDSPERFLKSASQENVVLVGGGRVAHSEVRTRGDVARFDASGYLQFEVEHRPSLEYDWTLFARIKEPKRNGEWNTLFRGMTDQLLTVHPQTRELGYFDVDGGRGFVGTGYLATELDNGNWHSLSVTRSGSRINYYVDGAQVGQVHDSTPEKLVYVGGGFGQTFSTYLDDVRYFDRAIADERPKAIADLNSDSETINPFASNAGAFLGSFSGVDVDLGDSMQLSLVRDSSGMLNLDPLTGVLSIADLQRFKSDTAQTFSLTVQAMDRLGYTYEKNFTLRAIQRDAHITADGNGVDVLNRNDASVLGGIEYAMGVEGDAFVFDGFDDQVRLRRSAWEHNGTNSYSFWFQTPWQSGTLHDTSRNIISFQGEGTRGWGLSVQANGRLGFQMETDTFSKVENDISEVLGSSWHFVSMAFRDSEHVRIRLDGRWLLDIPYSGSMGSTSNSFVRFGNKTSRAESFLGKIDDIRFSEKIPGDADIETIYRHPQPRIGNIVLEPGVPSTAFLSDDSVELMSLGYYLVDETAAYTITAGLDGSHVPVYSNAGVVPLDIDRRPIDWAQYANQNYPTDTILTQAIRPGDLQVHVANSANWYNGIDASQRVLEFLSTTSSIGELPNGIVAPQTIFDAYPENGIVGNTISLQTPYVGPSIPAGTKVRNRKQTTHHQFNLANAFPENRLPIQKIGDLSGIATPGQIAHTKFKPGTAFIVGINLANDDLVWSEFQVESQNTVSVLENQSFGKPIGKLKLLQEGITTYVRQDLGRAVYISPRGEIFLTQALDHEKQPYYNFQIVAVAVNGEQTSRNIRLEVKDVNEPIERIDVIRFPNQSLLPGTVVGTFQAVDPDRHDQFTYEIVSSLSSSTVSTYFAIHPSSGQLTRTSLESLPVGNYQVMVRATDLAGHTQLNGLTITKAPNLPGDDEGSQKPLWASSASVVEGDKAVVWLHRSDAQASLDVDYVTRGINAFGATQTGVGGDFLLTAGVLHFAAGEHDQQFEISTLYDLENEETEVVVVDFQASGFPVTRSAIRIDNAPRPTIKFVGQSSSMGADLLEGDRVEMEFEYANTNPGPLAFGDVLTFPWQTQDWSAGTLDYVANSGTVSVPSFGVHRFSTQIETMSDWQREDEETFFVTVHTPWGTLEKQPVLLREATERRLGVSLQRIGDGISGSSTKHWLVDEGSLLRFKITLDQAPDEPITLNLNTVHGSAGEADYSSIGLDVSFSPKEIEKEFSILVDRDFQFELNEHFYLSVETPWLSITEVDVEIRDESLPRINVDNVAVEGGSNAVFQVVLSHALTYPVAFNYTTRVRSQGGGLGSAGFPSGVIEFSAGQTAREIWIPTIPLPLSNEPYAGLVEFYMDIEAPWDRELAIGQVLYPGGFVNSGYVETSNHAFQFNLFDLYRDEFGVSNFPGYLSGAVPQTGFGNSVFELTSQVGNGYLKFYPTGDFKYRPNAGFLGQDSFRFRAISPNVTAEYQIEINLTNGSSVIDDEWFVMSGARSTMTPSVTSNDSIIGSNSIEMDFGGMIPAPKALQYTTTDYLQRPSLQSPYHYFGELASTHIGRYPTPSSFSPNWSEYYVDRHRLLDQLTGSSDPNDLAILNAELKLNPLQSGRLQFDSPYIYGDVPAIELKYKVSTSPNFGNFEARLRLEPESNTLVPPQGFDGSFGSAGPVWRDGSDYLLGNVFLGMSQVYQSTGSNVWRDLAGRSLIARQASEWEGARLYAQPYVPPDLIKTVPWLGVSIRGGQFKVQPDGNVLYTPPIGFTGTDWLAYVVSPDDGRMGIVGEDVCPSASSQCLDEFAGGLIQVNVRDVPAATPDTRANLESQSTLTMWTHDVDGVDSYVGPNTGIVVWNDHHAASIDLVIDGMHLLSNDIGITGQISTRQFTVDQFIAETTPWGYQLRVPVGYLGDKTLAYVLTDEGTELTFPTPVQFSVHGPIYDLSPPIFDSTPVTVAFAGMNYEYQAHAVEPNGRAIAYSLAEHPEGMTIDSTTGRIQWSIHQDHDATLATIVSVYAIDTDGEQAIQNFSIRVSSHNQPPVFTTVPEVDAEVGRLYGYNFAAFDQDADPLKFRLISSQGWVFEDQGNGFGRLERQIDTADLADPPAFRLEVSDGINAPVLQQVKLSVMPDRANRPPVITSKPVIRFEQAGSDLSPLGDVRETTTQFNRLHLQLQNAQTTNARIELRMSNGPPKVDVMLLLDDTGSFERENRQLADSFLEVVDQLRQLRPSIDFGFGVSRFDDFAVEYPGNRSNEEIGTPWTLNQPIISLDYPRFQQVLLSALDRTSRGNGGNDGEEAFIEALYQLASGIGLDANNNSSTIDNGKSGAFATQLAPLHQDIAQTIRDQRFEFEPALHPAFRLVRVGDQPGLPLNQKVHGVIDDSMSATVFRYEGQANEVLTLTSNLGWIDGGRYILNGFERDAGLRILSVYAPDGQLIRPIQNTGDVKQYLLKGTGQYAIVVDQEPIGAPRYGSSDDSIRYNEAENSSSFGMPFHFEITASSNMSFPSNEFATAIDASIDSTMAVGDMIAGVPKLFRLQFPSAATPILRILDGTIDWEVLTESGSVVRFGSQNEEVITPSQYRLDSEALSVGLERYSPAGNGAMPAGTYYLRLNTKFPQSDVKFRILLPQLASDPISVGQSIQHTLGTAAPYYFASLQGSAGQEVELEWSASNASSRFWLIAPDGTRVASVDRYLSSPGTVRKILPISGTYMIALSIDYAPLATERNLSLSTRLIKQHRVPELSRRVSSFHVVNQPIVTDLASYRYDVEVKSGDQVYFDGQNADSRVRVDYFKPDGSLLFSLFNSEMNRMMPQSTYTDQQYLQLEPIDLVADVSSDRLGGGGFRAGALPIIIAATDNGSRYSLDLDEQGCAIIATQGIEGATGDLRTIVGNSLAAAEAASCRAIDPLYQFVRGNAQTPNHFNIASVQDALDALVSKGALVVGVGTSPIVNADGLRQTPASMLEEIARLTGAINSTSSTLPNNIPGDGIAPGEPLYIATQDSDYSDSVSLAIQSALLSLPFDVDVVVRADPSVASLTSSNRISVTPNQSGFVDLQLTGDGAAHAFYLEFLRHGTGVLLGRMPIGINFDYHYDVNAVDPDDDPVRYRLLGETHGARIDAGTGEIAWTPPAHGRYVFMVEASDGRGGVVTDTWTVDVDELNAQNHAPSIGSIGDQTAEVNRSFELKVDASDPDGNALRFQLVGSAVNPIPVGMNISSTGVIQWTPSALQLGPHLITVLVDDGRGGQTSRSFNIHVRAGQSLQNRKPQFTSVPLTIAVVDQVYRYRVQGVDADGDSLQFRLSQGPRNMVLDPVEHVLAWSPTKFDLGEHPINVLLSDGHGGVVSQSFALRVSTPNEPPVFRSTPYEFAKIHTSWSYVPVMTDPNGDPVTLRLVEGPLGVSLTNGRLAWTPSSLGLSRVVIEAIDGRGGITQQRFTIEVVQELPEPNEVPIVTSNPLGPARIGNRWTYLVSAIDVENDPLEFHLLSAPSGMSIVPDVPGKARIDWTPASIPGNYTVQVWVSDEPNGKHGTLHEFSLPVSQVNQSPVVRSLPYDARTGSTWTYNLDVVDPDQDTLTFEWMVQQPGMTIDADRVIRWTPTLADQMRFVPGRASDPVAKIRILDGHGGEVIEEVLSAVLPSSDDGEHAYVDNNITGPIYLNSPWSHVLKAIDPNGDSGKITFQYVHLRRNGVPVPDGGAITVTESGLLTVQATSNTGLVIDDPSYEIVVKLIDEQRLERDVSIGVRFRTKNDWPRFLNSPSGELLAGQTWIFNSLTSDSEGSTTTTLAPDSVGVMTAHGIQFTPPANSEGRSFPLVILTSDGSTTQGEPIQIRQSTNLVVTDHPQGFPRIVSFPQVAIEYRDDALYSYAIQSLDSSLSYRISTGPDGMSVDAHGLVQWRPTSVGNYPVVIEVTNASQQTTTQRFTVSAVRPFRLNEPPEIVVWPTSPTSRDSQFAFPMIARDPNGDALEYSLAGPAWLSLHAQTGLLSGIPRQAGEYPVMVRVRETKTNDSQELFAEKSFVLTVLSNAPPRITSAIPPLANRNFIIGSSTFTYQVNAIDPNVEDGNQLRFSLLNPPIGATMDAESGLLTYATNDLLQRGVHNLVVQVVDSSGASDSQSFSVQALAGINAAPDFLSTMRATLPEGILYSLELQANDLDGDAVSFALEPLQSDGMMVPPPSGMRLENGSVIVWTPPKLTVTATESVILVGVKAISARDGLETIQRNTVTITKSLRNSPPVIGQAPAPFPAATVGYPYVYQPNVSDVDQDTVTWRLAQAPSSMVVDARTGRLNWAPTDRDLGSHVVTLIASDAYGGSDQQSFSVTVRSANLAPIITSTPINYAPIGQIYQYQVSANDLDQPSSQIQYALIGPLAGMSISNSGLVTWNVPPTLNHGAQFSVAVQVEDSRGGVARQNLNLTVYNPAINSPPIISVGLPEFWIVGDASPKQVEATDNTLFQTELLYEVIGAPQGMQIDSPRRTITWNPTESQIGYHTVSLVVFDGELYSRDTKRIWVRKNSAPWIAPIESRSLVGGQLLELDIKAMDADGDTLTFSMIGSNGTSLPAGMSIDSKDGSIRWPTPNVNQVTSFTFQVMATDHFGGLGTRSFSISVSADNQPPSVSFVASPTVLEPGRDGRVSVTASDDVGIQPGSRSLRLTGYSPDAVNWQMRDMSIALDSLARGTVNTNTLMVVGQISPIGFYRFEATARDLAGNTGYAGLDGASIVSVVADSTPPNVVIKSPTYNQSVFEPIDIFGTIDDPNDELTEYWVTIEPVGKPNQALEIKRVAGNREIKEGVIASLDSTLLDNGQWKVGIFAKDILGNIATASVPIMLEGNYKPGVLALSFTDLDLTTPDIPLRIQRSYSSSRANKTLDFGYGWALDFGIPKIEIAYEPHVAMGTSGFPLLVDGTRVHVRLPDGTVEGFTFQPYPKDPNLLGISVSWIPYFVPDKGNLTLLEADQTPVYRIANGETWEYVSFLGAESYHPASRNFGGNWKLTLASGTTMNVDARRENAAWFEDRNGNRSTVTPTSIEHWSGRKISIVRDANHDHRITSIADNMGASIEYRYSTNGNLIGVKDRSNQWTTMSYHSADSNVPDREHLLFTIVDPAGRQQMMVTYRSDRRIDTIQDAAQFANSYSYDIRSRTQSITNGGPSTNSSTQIVTDQRGNPVKVVDATNVTQINRFDSDGNMLQQRQVVGAVDTGTGILDDMVTSYRYNDFGQPIAVVDARGGMTQYTYENKSHQITTVISSLGLSTKYGYDSRGNLIQTTQPTGDQTLLSYSARGHLDTITDRNQIKVLDNEYDDSGNLIRSIGVEDQSVRFEYDGNGRVTAQILERTKDGRPFEMRSESVYDASDRVVSTRMIHRTLLATGQWQAEVVWSTESNIDAATGRLRWEIDQRGLRSDYFYDRRGNAVQVLREVETRTLNASGGFDVTKAKTSQWTTYDERGRVVLTTDVVPVPNQVYFASPPSYANRTIYDVAGRVIRTERLMGVVVRTTDSNGANPDTLSYSNYHDLRSEAQSDGMIVSSTLTEYDSAGRVVRSRDSNGLWTQTFYGLAGEIVQTRTQTKNEMGQLVWLVERTAFDDQGRPILASDSSLENAVSTLATRTFYDEIGRAFQTERRFGVRLVLLDRYGAVVRNVDASQGPFSIRIENQGVDDAGNINLISRSTQSFDDRGQLIRSVSGIGPGHFGIETRFEYDSRGRQIRQIGSPITTVDSLEKLRLVTETEFDNQGRAFRTWTNIRGRDSGGKVVFDRQFALSTTQIFDAMGRPYKTIYPDGTSTQSELDAFGQVITETDALQRTKRNTYDANGRVIAIQLPAVSDPFDSDNDGVSQSDNPIFEYAYDWAGNQTFLRDANGNVTTFLYDQQGRMIRRTLPSGIYESFTYDQFGHQDTHTSFEGNVSQSIYDHGNTAVQEQDPVYRIGTGRLMEKRNFAPNTYNNGLGTPQEVWRFKYDTFGRKVEAALYRRDQNNWIPHRIEKYVFNDHGQLIQESKPEGIINYAYDLVTGQRTRMWTTKAAGMSSMNLADAIEDSRYSYNALGWLVSVEVVEKNDRILTGNEIEKTRYVYDLLGRPIRTDLPNGIIERKRVDRMGSVQRIEQLAADSTSYDLGDNAKLADFLYSFDLAGNRTRLEERFWFDTDLNANTPAVAKETIYTWSYDPNDRLVAESIDSDVDNLDRTVRFEMDLFGNRLRQSTHYPSTPQEIDEAILYLYDANDRLVLEQKDMGGNGTIDESTSYAWDGTLQIRKTTQSSSVSTTVQSMQYSLAGMLTGLTTQVRDGQGNEVSRSRVEYQYDSMGMRINATDYDPFGENAWTVRSTTEYLLDNHNSTGYTQTILEVAKNAVGQATSRVTYTFGRDEITQTRYEPIGTVGWGQGIRLSFGHDAHGSVRAVYDAMSALVQVYTFGAYGALLSIQNSAGNMSPNASALTNLLYNGESFDSRIGQLYLRARWYDGHRFTTADPFAGNETKPLSFNKYNFAHSNPIGGIDPSGRILLAIDGTGQRAWLTDRRNPHTLANGRWLSHVRNFAVEYAKKQGIDRTYYNFGPSEEMWASDLPGIETDAILFIERLWRSDPSSQNEPIDIIGWSRGAYAALRLAQKIRGNMMNANGQFVRETPVRFLGLYDPVDMTFYDQGGGILDIARNVKYAISVYGEELPGRNDVDYDGPNPFFDWPRMKMINNWSTTHFTKIPLHASHGAIGGTPGYSPSAGVGYSYEHDREMSMEADRRIREVAIKAGVDIKHVDDYGFPLTQQGLPQPAPRTWGEYGASWRKTFTELFAPIVFGGWW